MATAIVVTDSIPDLRLELKAWEKSFALAHDGRKPTREDIKLDGTISEKYRRFNRLSRPQIADISTHTTPQKRQKRQALAERSSNISIASPQVVRSKAIAIELEQEIEPTPAHIRCALGPTPQKDGFVLSIFDVLASGTPSKARDGLAISGTPSKPSLLPPTTSQCSRTPQSSSKRFYLETFAGTPLKRKREDENGTPATAKRQFDTPAFLRRDFSFETITEENTEDKTTVPIKRPPGPRRGMARSFSSILANLRKQEEERMDDEWDIMKEIEAEEEAGDESFMKSSATQIKDSQAAEMPLGPDQPLHSDDESANDATIPGRKLWKKKGLKRQTKKTNMRPVLHAPQKAAELALDGNQARSDSLDGDIAQDGEAHETAGKIGETIKKTVRKVNEAAHMNFRRLKIKNKNSKANGRSGRFGKR